MREISPENIPRQLLHSLDRAVNDLFGQFPPPFDAGKFSENNANFQYLKPSGLAVHEVNALTGKASLPAPPRPVRTDTQPVSELISRAHSQQMVSKDMLETLISRGNLEGFIGRQTPGKVYKGRPRAGLESVDEYYHYSLINWLGWTGHGVDIQNGANLIFEQIRMTGFFWYPPNGYMAWHTNENRPGYRFYCVFAREDHKSFFRYLCPVKQQIITSWDEQGWNLRIFKIGVEDERLWHCVYSDTDRLSFGFAVHEP